MIVMSARLTGYVTGRVAGNAPRTPLMIVMARR
jgi:hypothetical protein